LRWASPCEYQVDLMPSKSSVCETIYGSSNGIPHLNLISCSGMGRWLLAVIATSGHRVLSTGQRWVWQKQVPCWSFITSRTHTRILLALDPDVIQTICEVIHAKLYGLKRFDTYRSAYVCGDYFCRYYLIRRTDAFLFFKVNTGT
jgi:hypothetical protein